jgi:DNA-binding beta-propeller fold protein YncE
MASPDGEVAGAFGAFGAKRGELQCPRSVTVDKAGSIYVVDSWNHRVQKFSPSGEFRLAFGAKGGPWGYDEADGKFLYPYGVAVDSEGYIYVADFNNNRIEKFDPRGKFVKKWGTEGRQDGQFSHPAGMAIDSNDRLYVADVGNGRIQIFTTEGDFDGKFVGPDGEFDRPYGVAVDSKGDVYVAEFGGCKVHKFTPSGKLIWSLDERGGGDGELDMPLSVAVDGDGFVYVADWGNNRIQKFAPPAGG